MKKIILSICFFIAFYSSFSQFYINPNDGKVGIGTATPSELFEVNGSVKFSALTENDTLTKILTSDNNGKIFWRPLPSGDNLGDHVPVQSILPSVDNSYDLGSVEKSFKSIYIEDRLFIRNFVALNTGTGGTGDAKQHLYVGAHAGRITDHSIDRQNTFVGVHSGRLNTLGSNNTFLGANPGDRNTTGSNNTYIGHRAGYYMTTGSNNIAIGYRSGPQINFPGVGTYSNTVVIGNNIMASGDNQFILGDNTNNIGIRNQNPQYPLHVLNAYCDGNTWFNASDENIKENFASLEQEDILAKVMQLKIQKWNYIGEQGASHIGPTAQNFNKVFSLGGNDKAIASVDEVGIALAAIQELNKKTEQLSALVKEQQQIISSLLQQKTKNVTEDSDQKASRLKLHQNHPNPFKNDTEISMAIPDNVSNAVLFIYDLNGKTLDQYPISSRGETSLRIEGGKLPSGIYLYALIADSEVSDIKRMVLTE